MCEYIADQNTFDFCKITSVRMRKKCSILSIDGIYVNCRVVSRLLSDVCEHIHCLYKLSDAVSMLDMLLSLAHACTVSDYGNV